MVDPHESDGKAHALLPRQIRLIETHHALTAFAGADQQNAGFAVFRADFVRWN